MRGVAATQTMLYYLYTFVLWETSSRVADPRSPRLVKSSISAALGSALFLEVTASIREWSAGLIPEQRLIMYLPEKRLAPLVLRKPLLVSFCVVLLVLFIVFSIFCITSFGGCFQCTRVFLSPQNTYTQESNSESTSPFLDWKYDSNKEVKRRSGKGKPCNRFNFQ